MNEKVKKAAIGSSVLGGAAAAVTGMVAAGSGVTGTISSVGAVVGGLAGGVVGSGVGLASAGVGMVATIPFAAGGAAIGSWAGPVLALVGIGTAPAWAIPVAIAGTVVAAAGTAVGIYRHIKGRKR